MRLAAVFLMLAACGASASPFGDDDDGDDVGGDDDGGDDDGGDDDGGDDAPGDDPDASPPGVCTDGLGAWTGHDNVPASQSPPCGLSPGQVPQFVSIGFDDNAYSGLEGSAGTGGMSWATAMAAGRSIMKPYVQ